MRVQFLRAAVNRSLTHNSLIERKKNQRRRSTTGLAVRLRTRAAGQRAGMWRQQTPRQKAYSPRM